MNFLKPVLVMSIVASFAFGTRVIAQEDTAVQRNQDVLERLEDYGFVLKSAVWPVTRRSIPVCWENQNTALADQFDLVQTSVDETWARYSGLEFTGWSDCPSENFLGIRILIANQNPHVKGLGTRISGLKNGMVLNFEFDMNGFRSCNDNETIYDMCVRSIAVHEFGHALGLAHEHNRDDRDASCHERPQGTDGDEHLTPYDPDSVMNYCNPKYNNFGKLSYFDVLSVQELYGKPKSFDK